MTFKEKLIYYHDLHDLYRKRPILVSGNISYANWWNENADTMWFTRFIRHNWPDLTLPIRFYSVFGPRKTLEKPFEGVKIFYTGENLEPRQVYPNLHERVEKAAGWDQRRKTYSDYGEGLVQLSIGFGDHTQDQYLRMPLWIQRYFLPDSTPAMIRARLLEFGGEKDSVSRQGAVVVSSHDFYGTRTNICDALTNIVHIDYAGNWRKSTDRLNTQFHNDKEAFLRNYRFNICPENQNAEGYVTEKPFDALWAGCIPIYQGAIGKPEPEVLNPDALILWNYETSHEEQIREIQRLSTDDTYYDKFRSQPIFLPGAAEYIESVFDALRNKMNEIFHCM